jgi:hypothetical protein
MSYYTYEGYSRLVFFNGNTPKALDISNGYHVVYTTNIPMNTTAGLQRHMRKHNIVGSAREMWHGSIHGFSFCGFRILFPFIPYCEGCNGLLNLTLSTTLLNIVYISPAFNIKYSVFGPAARTHHKVVDLMELKLCLTSACFVRTGKISNSHNTYITKSPYICPYI